MAVQKLDRILDCDNVVVLRFVDQVDNCRERGALSTAGRTGNENNSILDLSDILKLFRKVEVFEVRRFPGNNPHHYRVSASLFEDIHAKARLTRRTEGNVS